MRAVVKHNGSPLLDALCHINTASNIVTLQTMLEPGMNLDLTKFMLKSIFSGIWNLWKMMKNRKRTAHGLKAVGVFLRALN